MIGTENNLTAWIADGGGGGGDSDWHSDIIGSVFDFDIVVRNGGVLPVGNVQFLLCWLIPRRADVPAVRTIPR